MGLFKSKPTSYLGMDLGTSSIKLIELESSGGRPRLVTYGVVETDTDVSRENKESDHSKVAGVLKALLAKTGAKSRLAIAALPNFSVFSSVISLPRLDDKKLAEAVQWEAKKFVPMPIENVVLDWKVLGESEKSEAEDALSAPAPVSSPAPATPASTAQPTNQGAPSPEVKQVPNIKKPTIAKAKGNLAQCKTIVKILLTAAPKHLVERYVSIFKLAGIKLLSLETESFALSRSLIGNDPSTVLIVDIGSLTTDLTIVEKGIPTLARSIDVGGKAVTKAIADSMGISFERAEQFKRDVGIGSIAGANGEAVKKDGVSKIIAESFSPVINEMKYSIELHQNQNEKGIEKILITGGSAFLPSLPEYLSSQLNIKAFIGNPWARISYPKDLTEVLDQLAPNMAVPIGLAMREIE